MTFTKIHFLVSFHIVIQESLLSCLISGPVPNKDFPLYLVDQSLSGYVGAHLPDTFQDQQTPLFWLHGSFSRCLYETLAETYSGAGWLCSPIASQFPAIGSKVPQLTLTGFFPQAALKAEHRNSCFSANGWNFPEFELLMPFEFSMPIVLHLSLPIFSRKYLNLDLFPCHLSSLASVSENPVHAERFLPSEELLQRGVTLHRLCLGLFLPIISNLDESSCGTQA